MLFIFESSGASLVFERDIYFGETHFRVSNPEGENLEIAAVSIANSVNFPENPTKEQFKFSSIKVVRSNYRMKWSFPHLFSSFSGAGDDCLKMFQHPYSWCGYQTLQDTFYKLLFIATENKLFLPAKCRTFLTFR